MHDSYKKWLEDGCPKLICKCGCGQEIIVNKHWSSNGVPEHIKNHNKKGTHHSKKTKQKMSEIQKGRIVSEETKHNISKSNKGKIISEEQKQKVSKIHKGKILSEETKQKMSEARKGGKNPNFNN